MIAVFLPCAFGLLNAGRQRDFNNYCMKSFYVHNFDVKNCIVIFSIRILTKDIYILWVPCALCPGAYKMGDLQKHDNGVGAIWQDRGR